MSTNPYESALPPIDSSAGDGRQYQYRPANSISAWASWWLLVTSAFELLMAIPMFLFEPYLDSDPEVLAEEWNWPMESVLAIFAGYVGVACFALLLNVVGIVLYCVWVYRANKNAHALGAQGMNYTPGWTVGWHFIPIANLFKPYQAVKETFQASDPESGPHNWAQSETPGWLLGWWIMWIISNFLGQAEFRLGMREDQASLDASRYIGPVSAVVGVIAAFLVFKVIREIQARQVARYERQSKAIPASAASTNWSDFR